MKTRTFSSEVSIFTKLREGNVFSCVYSRGKEVSLYRVPAMPPPPMYRVQASVPSSGVEPQPWSPSDMFILVQFGPHCTEPPPDRFKLVHYEGRLFTSGRYAVEVPSCWNLKLHKPFSAKKFEFILDHELRFPFWPYFGNGWKIESFTASDGKICLHYTLHFRFVCIL